MPTLTDERPRAERRPFIIGELVRGPGGVAHVVNSEYDLAEGPLAALYAEKSVRVATIVYEVTRAGWAGTHTVPVVYLHHGHYGDWVDDD